MTSITRREQWAPLRADIVSTKDIRSRELYDEVVDQFSVETALRYAPIIAGERITTYCKTFVWDVTTAMGAEVPHWVDGVGEPAKAGIGARETQANDLIDWMETTGKRRGWHEVSPKDAQSAANVGRPTVAVWRSAPSGSGGHTGMVVPGEFAPGGGPTLAQAGKVCFRRGSVARGFGARSVRFWTHD